MRRITVFALSVVVFSISAMAFAEEVTCEDEYGSCTIEEYGGSCECYEGDAMDFGSVEATEPSQEMCLEMLSLCKPDIPIDSCQNERGACEIFEDWHECNCADGSNSGGGSSGSEPGYPDDPDDDPEDPVDDGGNIDLLAREGECLDILAEACPNDAPNPADECTDEALAFCNNVAAFAIECWHDDIWPYMIIDCCEDYAENADEIKAIYECMVEAGCDGVEECFEDVDDGDWAMNEELGDREGNTTADGDVPLDAGSDGEQNDESNDDEDGEGETNDATVDSDDCNQTGSPTMLLVFGLLIVLAFRRRFA